MDARYLERWTAGAVIQRARRGLHRHGVAGSIYLVGSLVESLAHRLIYLRQRHVWYLLDLSRQRPAIGLPPGLDIARVGEDGLPLLEQIPTDALPEGRRYLGASADLWIVRDGGRAVFSCWIFRDRTPALAARGGWLELPPGIVCLEGSVTSASHRGRGVAPKAWSAIADALAGEGVAAIVTKVEEANSPSRRAVEKAGFRAVASMGLVRIGPRSHVDVQPHGEDGVASFLVQRLAR